jgi:hypothetical protein
VKGNHEIRSENLTGKRASLINRDIFVFAFFLLLSFILWCLNFLGKEFETGFSYPVEFINLPKERVIVEESSSKLNLFLKGSGYSMFKLKVSGNRTPLKIDFSKINYKRVQGRTIMNSFILTSGLSKSPDVQLRSGCEITSIKPDTLFFTLEKVKVK